MTETKALESKDLRPDCILYHFPCTDGIASAAVAATHFFGNVNDVNNDDGHKVEFIAAGYNTFNKSNVDTWMPQFEGKNLLLLDFSFPNAVLEQLSKVAASIIIIDHHLTAQRELERLVNYVNLETISEEAWPSWSELTMRTAEGSSNIVAAFHMGYCGAALTHKILIGHDLPPALKLISDIDLGINTQEDLDPEYKRKLDYFMWWTRGQPFSLEAFMPVLKMSEEEVSGNLLEYGKHVEAFWANKHQLLEKEIVEGVWTDPATGDKYAYNLCFTDYIFCSQSAMALARTPLPSSLAAGNPEIPSFGVVVYFTKTGLGLSLRSEPYFEVAKVARSLGGGGHAQAAGCNMSPQDSAKLLLAIYSGQLTL